MKERIGRLLVSGIEFLRTRQKLAVRVGLGLLALLVAGDFLLVDKEHAHTKAEHWPAFWAIFGFIACVAIIFVSKWFGHLGIMTREDYYDR